MIREFKFMLNGDFKMFSISFGKFVTDGVTIIDDFEALAELCNTKYILPS